MEFGLLSEGFLLPGASEADRYHEVLRELQAAEEAGFDVVGLSEQHFIAPLCTFGSSEPVYGAIAATTNRIKIRTAVTLLPFHHPINVAERLAGLDILSRGRVEFGTGRGNSALTAGGFGIDTSETQARWQESLEIILKAWTEDEFSHDGTFFQIPPRKVRPQPVQQPHPPVWYAAISPESHELAGRLGLGLMTLTIGVDRGQVERRIRRYRRGQSESQPIVGQPLDKISILTVAYCAEDRATAFREAEEPVMTYLRRLVGFYEDSLKRAGQQVDFSETWEKVSSLERAVAEGMALVGDPETCIQWIRDYEALGVGEVLLRLEGVSHERILESIRVFGEHVIPAFKPH